MFGPRKMRGLSKTPTLSKPTLSRLSSISQIAHQNPTPIQTLVDNFTHLAHHGDLPAAMAALEANKIRADPALCSHLIKRCIDSGAVDGGRLIHRHLLSSQGVIPSIFLSNSLISMYIRFGLISDARELFDKMPDRNVVTWTTMISALTNLKQSEEAMELLVLMQRDGIRPNMYTFSSVLKACRTLRILLSTHCAVIKTGLESDVFVRSSLIDVYSKLGDLDYGYRVFVEMVTRDLVVWNSIIGGFAQSGDGYIAMDLFTQMNKSGFRANQGTLTSVLRACTSLALLETGKQVHVHVLKGERDLILNNALLDMYCKCGSLEEAQEVFDRMTDRDVISWSTMIAGFAQNGRSDEALRLFESMKSIGPNPNYITLVGVLFACSHAGLVEFGWYYFRSMERLFGIEPGREHYGCMVDLLGRAGKLDEAMDFIRKMDFEPDSVTWRTLLGACRTHRDVNLARYAAREILKLEPDDEGAYILLSNIYAKSRRWDDVESLRTLMRDRGVRKEPGRSWIEVGKRIHVFVVGDVSHPEIDGIGEEVRRLISRIHDAGYVPDTEFVLHDLGLEQKEDSLQNHSEKLAIAFGMMNSTEGKPIRIMKNLRICGDCHNFAKLVAKTEAKIIVIRDPVRFHHFKDGSCSCTDYW